ncbi:MAG: UDP-N-acetylmuramate dehydrogenase [Anaerolineales bacterium]|nr:UDP-N-acetylmuramate dehydrogenase [Anaerolineales bacterium]
MIERIRTLMDAIISRFQETFGDAFSLNEPLASHTTSGMGGPADLFVTVHSVAELVEAVKLARLQHLPYWVLGAGSNVLVSDNGMRGLVISNRAKGVAYHHNGVGVVLRAESGASFSALARRCASRGLAGLEWAAGIPGTVGGAVVGNAGAFGGDVSKSLRLATILDTDMNTRDYSPASLDFGYRCSSLKEEHSELGESKRVVLAAEFHLRPAPAGELEERVKEILAHRNETQPGGASMGCMFKNPAGDSAGRLIDQAGLKGFRIGGAHISDVHANFFINDQDACAEDIRKLMAEAWHVVVDRFKIRLEPEVELIGDWS